MTGEYRFGDYVVRYDAHGWNAWRRRPTKKRPDALSLIGHYGSLVHCLQAVVDDAPKGYSATVEDAIRRIDAVMMEIQDTFGGDAC